MNTKQLFRLLPMGIWMYLDLFNMRQYYRNIEKYRASGEPEKEKEEIFKAEWYWSKSLEKKIGAKIRIEGRENIPDETALYVSNHQSYCDIGILILAVERQIGYIAKEELSKLPLFGKWIAHTRSVFIRRDDTRESLKAIDKGIEYLRQGFNLSIFPEGTRSKSDTPGEFKKGSLRPAFKAEVPIVPVTINGSYKLWEEKGYPCPAEVNVFIHPAVSTKGVKKANQNQIAEDVERSIKEKLTSWNVF